MRQLRFIILAALFSVKAVQASFWYPDATSSLLEETLIQTHGTFNFRFVGAVTPCTNYVSWAQTIGRETAAKWVKMALYDFVIATVAAGTGSIGFETLRADDDGAFVNDALAFFNSYVNSEVSRADLIAMPAVISSGNCKGGQIPFRAGR
ncbi:hypothetical protein F5882DRAFT_299586 [Hyaloscypha sp. PMI_1271]|nr:hypothetical protein F5882DRAFT_299586 [Hyaloscypha sp. PMI_1271]